VTRKESVLGLLQREVDEADRDFEDAWCPAFEVPLLFRDRSRTSLPIVNGLYLGVLGRLPDDSGRELWATYLDQGSSASWMGFELLQSAEGRARPLADQGSTLAILRRAEILERTPILRARGVAAFLASPTPLEVVAGYLAAVGRCPNGDEVDQAVEQVRGGQRVEALLAAWAQSPEGLAYRPHLARAPGRLGRRASGLWLRPGLVVEWSTRLAVLRSEVEFLAQDPACLWIP
jgi:hypothetical protein